MNEFVARCIVCRGFAPPTCEPCNYSGPACNAFEWRNGQLACNKDSVHIQAEKNKMKKELVICGLILQATLLSISYQAKGQDRERRTYEENVRLDSLAEVTRRQEADIEQQHDDARNLSDLKSEKQDTKEKAREAQRVGNDANNAARQSKLAYRQERQAQKARNRADKQQKKAEKAQAKSDKN